MVLVVILIACCIAPWDCALTFEEPCDELSHCIPCQDGTEYDYVCNQLRVKLWFVSAQMVLSGALEVVCACILIRMAGIGLEQDRESEKETKHLLENPQSA